MFILLLKSDWTDMGKVLYKCGLTSAICGEDAILGKGGFGTVFKLFSRSGRHQGFVAAKIQRCSEYYQNDSNDALLRECLILDSFMKRRSLPLASSVTPHLIHALNACPFARITTSCHHTYSVMLMECLHADCNHIHSEFLRLFNVERELFDRFRLFFLEVARVLKLVHERGLAHGDLKWSNIFIVSTSLEGEKLEIRLGDWGLGVLGASGNKMCRQLRNLRRLRAARDRLQGEQQVSWPRAALDQ